MNKKIPDTYMIKALPLNYCHTAISPVVAETKALFVPEISGFLQTSLHSKTNHLGEAVMQA